ncbi:MAG: flagellar hook-basal body complex protein [Desulfobacterales bacterium]|nr:flagellar hook-basal body complex protein [Desulfobacterales bacterium]
MVKAYDSLGSSHDITIMYDKVSETEWEYIVVCNPEEDKRELVQGTESQGLLSRGSIEFSESSGKITNITMEEFTGRVGNVETGGMNSPDDIHFEVADGEAMPLDGYGLELSFDGNGWVLDPDSIPENYPDAQVVYSDDQNVHISLDPNDEGEADLKLKLDKPAMAGDTIGFDINDPNETHIQNLKNVSYGGGASENTHMEINDPNTMTRDAEGCGMVWNPVTEQWQWSNPEDAAANGSLVSDMVSNGGSSYLVNENTVQITNPTDMTQSSEDIGLRFDDRSGQWYWNEPLKTEDFTNPTYDFVPENNPTVSVVDPGTLGAVPSLDGSGNPAAVELEWDGTQWSVVDDGGCQVEIIVAESNASQVQFRVTPPGQPTTEGAVVQYSFDEELSNQGGQSLSFEINPTPPEEYANAQLTTSGVPAGGVGIDFNNNGSTDLIFDTALGTGAAPVDGDTLSFSVDPDVPPEEYPDAVIKGDENRAIIDLDGSGNEDDIEDIVFTFDEKLKTGTDTHPLEDQSYIQFDIEGSTAWREVPVDEAESTGYFQFTADFLGGDNGSTEMDISLNLGSRYDGENFVNDPLSTTQYSRASSTTYQDSDGYPPGDLTDVSVNADGVVTGSYSNGQQIPLFRVALADFNNENGLYSQGGNLFSATNDSGPAITNKPGENGLGSISPNTLEMSNVDITEEFTSMISLQRAFEANSTVITTVDSMMSTVIQMK